MLHRPGIAYGRLDGEPLQYVLGRWSFRGLDLIVDPRVLIPRPETEVVAEVAVGEVRRRGGPSVVADLGTGSGALALALAVELPDAEVHIVDPGGHMVLLEHPAAVNEWLRDLLVRSRAVAVERGLA